MSTCIHHADGDVRAAPTLHVCLLAEYRGSTHLLWLRRKVYWAHHQLQFPTNSLWSGKFATQVQLLKPSYFASNIAS
jgi:hypothetical protein